MKGFNLNLETLRLLGCKGTRHSLGYGDMPFLRALARVLPSLSSSLYEAGTIRGIVHEENTSISKVHGTLWNVFFFLVCLNFYFYYLSTVGMVSNRTSLHTHWGPTVGLVVIAKHVPSLKASNV